MAYDTLETAKDVSLSSSTQTFANSISRIDSTDYYRFQFKSYGSLSAVLNHLNGDVNLELIQDRDRNGVVSSSEVLSASNNSSAIGELINTTLAPGTYYLRVSTSQDSDRYSLDLSATSDLKTNLVWRNYATGENAAWQMKDNAIDSAVFLTKVTDPNWKLETTADFNHDGQADLFWRNYATGENAVWQMKGNAIDSVVYFTKVPDLNWKLAGVADFNNDGQADLIWRNYATGENAVWQMKGNAIDSVVYFTKVPDLNWKLAGVADYNNDGQADLIWRNYATGDNAVWQMKGNAIESAVWLLKIPDPNWQLVSTSKQFAQTLTNDAVGNTIANAFDIGTLTEKATFRESIGTPTDREDDYQFTLSRNSSLTLALTDLSANVDLQLLDSKGAVIQTSAIAGNSAESISSGQLSAGTYYVRLYSNASDAINYTLNLSAALPIYQYGFTYYYNGFDNCKDYYTGYVYSYSDTYSVGQWLDPNSSNNETGSNGKYLIQSAIAAGNVADVGKVFVDHYHNSENSTAYTPVYFGQGNASGTNLLGSEYDFIGNSNSNDNDFGLDQSVYDVSYSKYNFTYYYNGKDNAADYYTGWVYAQTGTYTIGSFIDPNPNPNETGLNGKYLITALSRDGTAADVGNVFVDRYYDIDNSRGVYTPFNFSQGKASGTQSLGSELDYASNQRSTQTDFGRDAWEFDAQPDLSGAFFEVAQSSLFAGSSLSANFRVKNTGTDAKPFQVAFYLSKDATITTGDRLLGTYDVDAIAANNLTATLSKTFSLPGVGDAVWQGNRTYYIGMVIDSLNVVSEANESNNANQGSGIDSKEVLITTAIANPVVNYGAASGNPSIEALWNASHAYWNTSANGGVIPYSFYTNGSGAYTGNETVSEVSSLIKSNVRSILSSIESYINVRFVEVADTATSCGVIRYLYSDGRSSANSAAYSFYAYGYYPGDGIGSDVHLNPNQAASFEEGAGSYGYTALLHETLHTLGLKHPGNYNVGGGTTEGPYLSPSDDNLTNTVMTYNNGTSDTKYTGSKASTLMNYDIRALQYLYGARDYNANMTSYAFNTVYGYAVGSQFFGSTTTPLKQSIWDAGGIDTLDFSGLSTSSSYRFDLNPGGILTTQSSYNGSTYYDYGQDYQPTDGISQGLQYVTSNFGTTIAYGTVIENLINSHGNDYIIANAANNVFKGYTCGISTGNDVIESGSAADVVELAGYTLSNLTTTVSGSNLTIGLGSSGSIQLQNYYGANGSLKFLVGGTYYTYSSGGWQAAAPAAIAPPNTSDAIVTGGLTSTVASTSRMQPLSQAPAACMCPLCSGKTAFNQLGTLSLALTEILHLN